MMHWIFVELFVFTYYILVSHPKIQGVMNFWTDYYGIKQMTCRWILCLPYFEPSSGR